MLIPSLVKCFCECESRGSARCAVIKTKDQKQMDGKDQILIPAERQQPQH